MKEFLGFLSGDPGKNHGKGDIAMTAPTALPCTPTAPPDNTMGIDTDQPMDEQSLATLREYQTRTNQTFKFIGRYIPLDQPNSTTLTHDEAVRILNAGYALLPLIKPRTDAADIKVSKAQGTVDGKNVARNAQNLGIPTGTADPSLEHLTQLYIDIEQLKTTPASVVIDYVKAFAAQLQNKGYGPCMYFGQGTLLHPNDLSKLQGIVERFMTAYNIKPNEEPPQGVVIKQMQGEVHTVGVDPVTQKPLPGDYTIDIDQTRSDAIGGHSVLLYPAAG